MREYVVKTRVTVERTYHVEADNEKAAVAETCNCNPTHEEDSDCEETLSAWPVASSTS